jgi:hypothetical protein
VVGDYSKGMNLAVYDFASRSRLAPRTGSADEAAGHPEPSVTGVPSRTLPARLAWAGVSLAVVATIAAAVVYGSTEASGDAHFIVGPVTCFPGREIQPTSPNGTQVAFAWEGEARKGFDICVRWSGRAARCP